MERAETENTAWRDAGSSWDRPAQACLLWSIPAAIPPTAAVPLVAVPLVRQSRRFEPAEVERLPRRGRAGPEHSADGIAGESRQRPEQLHRAASGTQHDIRVLSGQPDRPTTAHAHLPAVPGMQHRRPPGTQQDLW